jgi:Transposase
MIGVDPHKGSHTAIAVGGDEAQLAKVRGRSSRHQLDQLLKWAVPFEQRTWAIESAGGLGYLLAQQLVAAGETVLDVPATLAARVRVLGTGRSNKKDPNDALSVAVAALRAPRLALVARADHVGVLRLVAKRNNDLGRARNKTACRLHALLAELVPGGIPNEINASSAERMLTEGKPQSPVAVARHALALEHLDDLRRLDTQMRTSKAHRRGHRRVGDLAHRTVRPGTRRRGNAHRLHRRRRSVPQPRSLRRLHRHRPHRSVFGRSDHAPPLATRQPTAQPRPRHRRDYPRSGSRTPRAARSSNAKSPKARPRRKPSAPSSGGSPMLSTGSYSSTPAR